MSKVHSHLLVSASIRSPDITAGGLIHWLNRLVELVDMEVFMGARARYCEDPDNSGITGDVVITTSHSSIHIWDKPGKDGLPYLEFDLYSCKEFDPEVVLNHLRVFDLVKVDWMLIDRSNKTSIPTWNTRLY